MKSTRVVIVDYDPRWPGMFEAERIRIIEALGGMDSLVEHVGSTAVPGLAAKPTIDILVIVPDSAAGTKAVPPLTALGYEYRGELGIPGRFYFSKGRRRTHHVHLYPRGHPEIARLILFRDHLRAHPDAARAYAGLKRALAERFRDDREAYTVAKSAFIKTIEDQARMLGGLGRNHG